ncbi:OmpA family protein [Alphaproteobacteria bacterium]|jgi:chemotaxis protein MotB|nr:OmpA family protein [Alphaproteobacteria bacterium]
MHNGEQNAAKLDKDPAPLWLLSFGDVTALLLTFFVLLFSMSTLQSEKWEVVTSKLNSSKQSFNQLKPMPNAVNNVSTVELVPALPLGYLGEVLEEKLQADPVLARAIIHRLEGMIVVSLPFDLLFAAGEVTLTDVAKEALFRMGGVIATLGNQIDIEGHSAPKEDENGIFTSAWTMSLARAVAVSNELVRSGYIQNTTVLGLGASRFNQIDQRLSYERRSALARRVDIVIHPDQGDLQ